MTLHLIRHASAGSRNSSDCDDFERPLDERGLAQAAALVIWFADLSLRDVWSSPARRCQQTVVPLAAAHGLKVSTCRELTEGVRPADLLALLSTEASLDGDLVMCSHGDVIPEVLNRLLRQGMTVTGPRGCDKGSIWSLETQGQDIVSAVYTAAPTRATGRVVP